MTPPAWAKDKDGVYRVFPAHLLTQFPDGKWGFTYNQLLRNGAQAPSRIQTSNPYFSCFEQFRHLFEDTGQSNKFLGRILKEPKK